MSAPIVVFDGKPALLASEIGNALTDGDEATRYDGKNLGSGQLWSRVAEGRKQVWP